MFFRNITADYRRVYNLTDNKPRLVRAVYPFTCPGFHALIWYRLIQANRHWHIPVLFYVFALPLRMINTFVQWFWGICVASNCEIGPGLYIAHHGQIFVGVKSMGANCTIGHNVTIGRTEKEHGYPSVGDNVYFAPGAVVIGQIDIGDNVKIGPNAVVRRSVQSNSVVIAPPPRVIRLTTKDEWLRKKDTVEDNPPPKAQSSYHRKDQRKQPAKKPYKHPHRTDKVSGKTHANNRKPSGYKPKQYDGKGTKVKHKQGKPGYGKTPGTKVPYHNRGPKKHSGDGDRNRADDNKGEVPRKVTRETTKDEGSHWKKGSMRDKWDEDMDGEALDD